MQALLRAVPAGLRFASPVCTTLLALVRDHLLPVHPIRKYSALRCIE